MRQRERPLFVWNGPDTWKWPRVHMIAALWYVRQRCSHRAVADRYGVEEHTVGRWVKRYDPMVDWSRNPSALGIWKAMLEAEARFPPRGWRPRRHIAIRFYDRPPDGSRHGAEVRVSEADGDTS